MFWSQRLGARVKKLSSDYLLENRQNIDNQFRFHCNCSNKCCVVNNLEIMKSYWVCYPCQVIFMVLALNASQSWQQTLPSSDGMDLDAFYPPSGAHMSNPDCLPVPHKALLKQLGQQSATRRHRKLSLSGSRQSQHRLPKQVANLLEAGSSHYMTGNAELDDFLSRTFVNFSLHSHRHGHLGEMDTKPRERRASDLDSVEAAALSSSEFSSSSSLSSSSESESESESESSFSSSEQTDKVPVPFRHPPWKCEYKPRWVRMDEDIFPPFIQSGDCEQTDCFFGMYECKPKKYVMKVLKRRKNKCHPLPLEGANSTYEEAWEVGKVKVIVACECGLKS